MFSTEFAQIAALSLSLLALVCAVAAFFFSARGWTYVRRIEAWAVSDWQKVLHDSKVGDLENRITEAEDSLASHHQSIKRLRSKYAMRDMREKKREQETEDRPNGVDSDDEDAFIRKKRLRAQAKKLGFLR